MVAYILNGKRKGANHDPHIPPTEAQDMQALRQPLRHLPEEAELLPWLHKEGMNQQTNNFMWGVAFIMLGLMAVTIQADILATLAGWGTIMLGCYILANPLSKRNRP